METKLISDSDDLTKGSLIDAGALILIVKFSLFIKVCMFFFGYSGEGVPPMYGDFEAQRHWMEITVHLPTEEWYFNTTNNDLNYWGLDYPPLTAYHSYICGWIAHLIDPEFVALGRSRGHESSRLKVYMRSTVLISDLLVYTTSIVAFSFFGLQMISKLKPRVRMSFETVLLTLGLLYPGLILIDHGHFQYNCVFLGLAILSIVFFVNDYDILGSIFFVLSLSFKQMSLYYSLPVFFWVLGKGKQTLKNESVGEALNYVLYVAFVVLLTFAVVWFPFLHHDQIIQVFHRIFPLARGLYEDKVSNLWCILNVLYKFRLNIPNETMAFICSLLTLIFALPSCFHLFYHRTPENLIVTLINSSLAFFLCSFQVHEKSILLVATPVLLYTSEDPFHCVWFLFVSTFSMLPLLIKDSLLIPFIALNLLFLVCIRKSSCYHMFVPKYAIHRWMSVASLVGYLILGSLLIYAPAPAKYPDLYPLLISMYSASHFIYFYVYFNCKQWRSLNVKEKWV